MIGGARGAGFSGCCLLFDFGSSGIVCPSTRRCEAMRWWAAIVAPASQAAACSSTLAAAQRHRLPKHVSVRGDTMIGGARGAGFFGCCLIFDFGSSGIVCAGTRRCEAMRWPATLVAPGFSLAACSSTLAAAASLAQKRSGARRCDDRRRQWRRLLLCCCLCSLTLAVAASFAQARVGARRCGDRRRS